MSCQHKYFSWKHKARRGAAAIIGNRLVASQHKAAIRQATHEALALMPTDPLPTATMLWQVIDATTGRVLTSPATRLATAAKYGCYTGNGCHVAVRRAA